jgi:hypothetical protein
VFFSQSLLLIYVSSYFVFGHVAYIKYIVKCYKIGKIRFLRIVKLSVFFKIYRHVFKDSS